MTATEPGPARSGRLREAVLGVVSAVLLAFPAHAQDAAAPEAGAITKSHGYSYFGDLTYPADFEHLAYVNPEAPKGGALVLAATGTFDSLNPYSRKGVPGVGTGVLYDSLLESTDDLVGEYYGVLAESLEYPEDRSWVIFHMRPEATFSDGSPVTAEDVVYSHTLFITQGLPSYAQAVSNMVTGAEALDEHTVKFTFNPEVSRRGLVETVGSTPVFSKAWFEADESRRLDEPRLEVAVGSGPYELDHFEVNRRISYKRRADYWGADRPMNVGKFNYDEIRYEYFTDQTASFEAFKAGEYNFRVESDPKVWATSYDFPKIDRGSVVLQSLPDRSPPNPTGFVFNLGRPQLQDKTVREAIGLAFNFEWTNASLLYGLYAPRSSFVQGTHIEAKGTPEGAELAFLKSLGDVVPEEIFTAPAQTSPVSDPERLSDRRNLRTASRLLDEAGWAVGDDGIRRNAAGETLELNLLLPSNIQPTVEAMHEAFVRNLTSIGVDATFEKIDPSQYTLRRRERDYDMLYSTRYGAFLSTGGGLTQMYGSKEAEFSLFNPAGLASPLVDAVLEASFVAQSQEETEVALMALDRVLRYEYFIIPDGYIADYWVAHYDMFEHPENLPPFALGYGTYWWIDTEKEQALRESGALN
ncbi:extracellular solute-binding protein [Poseidonocella sedimentorum]|nr:extracellular solute-binding protein [Poseidonocella sedimentorum]